MAKAKTEADTGRSFSGGRFYLRGKKLTYGKITKILQDGLFVMLVRDKAFNPTVGQVLGFIPDKKRVDTKRKQIFALFNWLAENADYSELLGEDAHHFKGYYLMALRQWKTTEHAEWFRNTIMLDAGLTEPARCFYYIDNKRMSFDGVKPISLGKDTAGLKELTVIYEELKRHCAEKSVDLTGWHETEEGYHE